jgi:prepilin-type N-terminal cleavage/methylation domain-containing protein
MTQRRPHNSQSGFTIIETMIAIAIMSIGILTVLAAFATAVGVTQNAQENLIARQKTLEAMESIYTARNTQQITFSQIANTPSGIFTSGPTQLLAPGNDGLVNTTDDAPFAANLPCAAGPECIVLPGPDGILGTADDKAMSLANFTREIQISKVFEADGVTVNPNLKQVTVIVTYTTGTSTVPRAYTVNALVSAFR